jgi:hypothetical protein
MEIALSISLLPWQDLRSTIPLFLLSCMITRRRSMSRQATRLCFTKCYCMPGGVLSQEPCIHSIYCAQTSYSLERPLILIDGTVGRTFSSGRGYGRTCVSQVSVAAVLKSLSPTPESGESLIPLPPTQHNESLLLNILVHVYLGAPAHDSSGHRSRVGRNVG